MIPNMVGKLSPSSSHLTRGLVKHVPGRGYFSCRSLPKLGQKCRPLRIVELVDQARQSPSRGEEGGRPFDPVSTAATEGLRTRPWPFTPRTESAISFQGPLAEENSNPCYTFGMANDEEPFERALMALSSVAVTSEDSVNSNLATLMVDNETSGHYFDDVIIRDLKHRPQEYVHLTTPRKFLSAGGAIFDSTAEGVLQGLVINDNGNQILI